MNKELKAFYELKESIEYKGGDFYCANQQRLDIIETALNEKANIEKRIDEIFKYYDIESFTELEQRLESYEDLVGDLSIEFEINKENQKKLKALDIIKKHISVYEESIIPLGKPEIWHIYLNMEGYLDEKHEEYDLLKEVLL